MKLLLKTHSTTREFNISDSGMIDFIEYIREVSRAEKNGQPVASIEIDGESYSIYENELLDKVLQKLSGKEISTEILGSNSTSPSPFFNVFADYIFPVALYNSLSAQQQKTITTDKSESEQSNTSSYFSWLNSYIKQITSLLKNYSAENINFKKMLPLIPYMLYEDYLATLGLAKDYLIYQYKNSRPQLPSVHPVERSEEDRLAYFYFRQGKELSEEDAEDFKELLKSLEQQDQNNRRYSFFVSETIIRNLLAKNSIHYYINKDKSAIENEVKQQLFRLHEINNENELNLTDRLIIEMSTSRMLLLAMDQCADKTQHVAFLAAAYDEHNRLSKKSKNYSGEDFLRVKVQHLNYLFSGLSHFFWTLTFVEDQERIEGKKRSIDAIKELCQNDLDLKLNQDKINTLDYDEDLTEERQLYAIPELAQADSTTFAKGSVKGGAIQTGLRYLARVVGDGKSYKVPPADFIIYTDCDTSVNLANAGILLDQLKTADICIGSRRVKGSHVIGKSAERHLQSFVYNMLVRFLLNLQINDTQVGEKALKPDVIKRIHQDFSEISMAFDAELLKLADDAGCKIAETGIVWIDSEVESKSANQGMKMFSGLLNIYKHRYKHTSLLPQFSTRNLYDIGEELSKEKKFPALLRLANNAKWNLLIKHATELYDAVTPKAWNEFVGGLKDFILSLSNNSVKPNQIEALIQQAKKILETFNASNQLQFFFHEFPEVLDTIELLHHNIDYAKIIAPMLLGTNVATKAIFKSNYPSFYQFVATRHETNDVNAYFAWLRNGEALKAKQPTMPKKAFRPNLSRIESGSKKLAQINADLKQKSKSIKIGIVMFYNMDATSEQYVDKTVRQKLLDLKRNFGEFTNIQWEIIIVDGRKVKISGIDEYIISIIQANNDTPTLHADHIAFADCHLKPIAVRKGMDYLGKLQCDYVGYIDFSDKINILEISNLIATVYEQQKNPNQAAAIAIASRRQEESHVENKPLTFILRSQGLNLLIKAFFPLLSHLTDTQTGFKMFSVEAWKSIKEKGLQSSTLAFDIEILQQAARLSIPVIELPIDFDDNSQNLNGELGETLIMEMLDDILVIRARLSDARPQHHLPNEALLLGGGAENAVFILNDSLIKIPHGVLDPEFYGVLKNFIFKHRTAMTVNDQGQRVVSSLNSILVHPLWKRYIPLLRNWKEFNTFVMKVVAAYENKNYTSAGYESALFLGRDLVIPFRFIDQPFSCFIDGAQKTFYPDDRVIHTLQSEKIFKDKFNETLSGNIHIHVKIDALKKLIDEGISLFYQLWERGLFDLDANLLDDTGYHRDNYGQLRLMVLDPGELISDFNLVKQHQFTFDFTKRFDFIELTMLLDSLAEDEKRACKEEVLDYYIQCMKKFYQFCQNDTEKTNVDERKFGSLTRNTGTQEYKIKFPCFQLPPPATEEDQIPHHRVNQALVLSKKNYVLQTPYKQDEQPPALMPGSSGHNFIRVASKQPRVPMPHEYCLTAPVGSIKPTLDVLNKYCVKQLNNSKSLLVLLDAGTATRSSLLKFAGDTKGGIVIGGNPLYQHISNQFSALMQNSNLLQNDFIILVSSDDLIEFTNKDIQTIEKYFQLPNQPGIYWCDLPNAGREILPATVADTYQYLKNHAELLQHVSKFIRNIPGASLFTNPNITSSNESIIKIVLSAIYNFTDILLANQSPKDKPSVLNVDIPGIKMIADYYQQFLQFQAGLTLNGLKTPFFMIMTKEFYHDFCQDILPLIPNYITHDITWANFLIFGLKADKTVWLNTFKPSLLTVDKWLAIWEKIQTLKLKHHIDTNDTVQNSARVFTGRWHNFDDPHALATFISATFSNTPHHYQQGNVTIISDNALDVIPDIQGTGQIIFLNSTIEGKIISIPATNTRETFHQCLLYNVILPKDKTFTLPPNHLVVQIRDTIYSVSMELATKDELKSSPVYIYDDNGVSANSIPYDRFVALMRENHKQPSSIFTPSNDSKQPHKNDSVYINKSVI